MPDISTRRPYRERFLDNFDRGQLRREIEKIPSKKLSGFRRKYASWALGATLAVGGIGMPLQMVKDVSPDLSKSADPSPLDGKLEGDLNAARSIARQVAGGVAAAAGGVEAAARNPLTGVAEAPQKLAIVTEKVREDFFKTEVPFGSLIYHEAKKHDLKPELVAAVVEAESQFKPTARSGPGAVGLMQLMPRTGKWMGARDLTNPKQNVAAGTKYLKYLEKRFDGNETKMIAAYNAGEGNVKRFGGVPPFKETKNYVKKVKNYEKEYRTRVESRIADASTGGDETRTTR